MGAEVIRQFPFVDAVVSGEGDLVFADLVERILAGDASIEMPGVYTRGGRSFVSPGDRYAWAPMVRDMDALPVPDYDEFFEQWELAHLDERERTTIQFETSRGCWWGERHHCTFCGLNGATMTYRSKSSQRALDELVALTDRYPGHPVSVVDNILDHRYFKDFMPALAARRLDLELFYEVKANLKKAQVRLLRDAGVRVIQPGIESFSTRVLDIMRKGERGLHNIQLLKWCKELGVTPVWNLLWGFPGEPPEEYRAMADLLPLLTHLAPPIFGHAHPARSLQPEFRSGRSPRPHGGGASSRVSLHLPVSARGRRQSRVLLQLQLSRATRRGELYEGRGRAGARVARRVWRIGPVLDRSRHPAPDLRSEADDR